MALSGRKRIPYVLLLASPLAALMLLGSGCGVTPEMYNQKVQEAARLREELSLREKAIEKEKEKAAEVAEQIEDLRAQRDSLRRQLALVNRRADEAAAELARLRVSYSKLTGSETELQRRIEALESDRRALKEQVRLLNARLVKEREKAAEKEEELLIRSKVYENLASELRKEIAAGQVKLKEIGGRLTVTLLDKILFPSGSSEINPQGRDVLMRLGEKLKGIKDKQIQVEGHTDNVPIGPALRDKFPTNWELSTQRATQVVRYLEQEVGIDPRLLSAAGYSEFRPVATNETPEGRQQNRRIEIVLVPLRQPLGPKGSPPASNFPPAPRPEAGERP